MKRILTICFAAFLLLNGWTASSAATLQDEDSIRSIRQQYAAINKRTGRYRKVKKELSGFSLEGGELTAYFDGPSIVKIVANHYGEMGKTLEEYYYASGRLIFVFERVSHYDRPMSGKVIRTLENRYYFGNDKLIRWINEKGKQADTSSEDSQTAQKDFLENSNTFTAAARTRKRTIERRSP